MQWKAAKVIKFLQFNTSVVMQWYNPSIHNYQLISIRLEQMNSQQRQNCSRSTDSMQKKKVQRTTIIIHTIHVRTSSFCRKFPANQRGLKPMICNQSQKITFYFRIEEETRWSPKLWYHEGDKCHKFLQMRVSHVLYLPHDWSTWNTFCHTAMNRAVVLGIHGRIP
jgi:hypothetical protein